jgi:hypothetical protein
MGLSGCESAAVFFLVCFAITCYSAVNAAKNALKSDGVQKAAGNAAVDFFFKLFK